MGGAPPLSRLVLVLLDFLVRLFIRQLFPTQFEGLQLLGILSLLSLVVFLFDTFNDEDLLGRF